MKCVGGLDQVGTSLGTSQARRRARSRVRPAKRPFRPASLARRPRYAPEETIGRTLCLVKGIWDEWRRFWGRPGLAFALSFAFWVLVWALVSGQSIYASHARDLRIPWTRILLSLGDHLQWGLAAPFVVWFCARRPVARGDLARSVAYQMAAWLVIPALFIIPLFAWRSGMATALSRSDLALVLSVESFLRVYVWAFLAYLDLAVVAHALYYARELRSRELRAAQLETRLAEARLDVLRMQIHPHFLFNTLHSIATLMHRDVASAERMLVLLGDLLRDSLARDGRPTVSLERELDFLERYLEIEGKRFGDRLTVHRAIDPATLRAEVPSLLLQPLVENALRHGLGRKPGPGRLALGVERIGDLLELRVKDDGAGPSSSGDRPGSGVGLANTRARLQGMYGAAHSFATRQPEEGGFEVVVRIPYRTGDPEPSSGAEEANRCR